MFVRVLLLIIIIQGLACSSYTQDTAEIRQEFRGGRYKDSLEKLEKSDIAQSGRNRLLYRLERGSILDAMGDRKKSRTSWVEADKIADELYTVSVSKTATSFIVNDAQTDYDGEDYEKVAIHTMLALSYLQDNDLKNARIEAMKINTKLAEINAINGENKNRYGEDAFARFLSAMIYEALGEWDSAIIDYKAALNLYEDRFKRYYDGSPPDSLIMALARVLKTRNRTEDLALLRKKYEKVVKISETQLEQHPDYSNIVVIHQVGSIALKENVEFALPIGGQIVRFSFPVIKRTSGYSFGGGGVTVEPPGTFFSADQTQNMSHIASDTLEDRRTRMVVKAGARLLAKGQMTRMAYENLGVVGGLAANIYSAVTETGDTRSWTLLPHAFYVSWARVKPGTHTVHIKSRSGKTNEIEKVTTRAKSFHFYRDLAD